jgi:hypothetical protein
MSDHTITIDTSDLESDRRELRDELDTLIESIPEPEDEEYIKAVEALANWLGVNEVDHIEFFGSTPWTDPDEMLERWASDGDGIRLKELEALRSEISEWRAGVTLIREDTFEGYARQYAEETGCETDGWPYGHIDWEEAAESLARDYRQVAYDNDTWLCRA